MFQSTEIIIFINVQIVSSQAFVIVSSVSYIMNPFLHDYNKVFGMFFVFLALFWLTFQ